MIEQDNNLEYNLEDDKKILEFRDFLQKFKCINIDDKSIIIKKDNIKYKNDLKIDCDEYNLRYPKSSSLFKKIHHHKMNIIIKNVKKEQIVNIENSFKNNKIIDGILNYYKTLKNSSTEKQCNIYINKINEIIKNTKKKKSYESIVDDFVRLLFEILDFDDGKTLNIQSQYKLHLKIGSHKIPSIPDLICKNNNDIIWMVEESKHINNSTYLDGDLQLICHMFSAFQYNIEKNDDTIVPKTIFGFKIKNTKCFFYKIDMSNDYIKCLIKDNFDKSIIVYKYPEKGIDINPYNINSYKNIKEIFDIMFNLRQYAIKLFS